jgi:hypothetical protein
MTSKRSEAFDKFDKAMDKILSVFLAYSLRN